MTTNFPISFTKMSGTGNDFIIMDHRRPFIAVTEQPDFARKICRRMFSAGADGLILIEESGEADFSWRFYNADGSMAEMCGNGARCAARYAFINKIAGPKMTFETLAGIIEAEVLDESETVRLRMTPPFDFRLDLKLNLGGMERDIFFVNTGVPHAVIFVDDDRTPVQEWGREVRYHSMFQPAGSNANFVRHLASGELQVRTYERGVEDETMACGTGAVAAALIAAALGRAESPVRLITSGGEPLTVLFDLKGGPKVDNVFLQGPARIIYEGKLTAESLL
jgi:diaminopimelate epimerase